MTGERLPPPTARIALTASLTDAGTVRSDNQDFCGEFADDAGWRLLVVADGMGGHLGGAVASRTAVHTIGEVFQRGFTDPAAMLRDAIALANERVHAESTSDPELHGMGTTGVALLLGPATAWVAHVGDSRAYRLRHARLEELTADHSWVAEEVRQGRLAPEQAGVHPRKNVLTRSIGVEPAVEGDVASVDLEPGDRLLLCSDGLWGEVPSARIAEVLGAQEPHHAAKTLVELANAHGGRDNVTVQIVEIPAGAGTDATDDAWPRAAVADPAPARAPVRGARQPRRMLVLSAAAAAVTALLVAAIAWLVAGVHVGAPAPREERPGGAITP